MNKILTKKNQSNYPHAKDKILNAGNFNFDKNTNFKEVIYPDPSNRDFSFHIQVKDGEVDGWFVENNLEDLIKFCKMCREQEANLKGSRAKMGFTPPEYYISPGMWWEFESMGFDMFSIIGSNDKVLWKPIDALIELKYPYMKTVNYKLNIGTKVLQKKKD